MPSSLLQRIICKQNGNLSLLENSGCLPFTWANHLVHGLGKWSAKFRTLVNFISELHLPIIIFTQISSILKPKNHCKSLKLLQYQRWLEKRELEFPSGTFRLEKQDYLNFRCSVAPEKFSSGTRKRQVPFAFQPDFLETLRSQNSMFCFDVVVQQPRHPLLWMSKMKNNKSINQ